VTKSYLKIFVVESLYRHAVLKFDLRCGSDVLILKLFEKNKSF